MAAIQQAQELPVSQVIQNLDSRIRTNEARYRLLSERLEVTNRNMIREFKKTVDEIKDFQAQIKELKYELREIKDMLNKITKDLELFAKKDTVKALEKYVNLWDPLNFITKDELEQALSKIKNK